MLAFPAKLSQILYVEYIVYKLQMVQLMSFMLHVDVLLLSFGFVCLFLLFQPIFQKRFSLVHVKAYFQSFYLNLRIFYAWHQALLICKCCFLILDAIFISWSRISLKVLLGTAVLPHCLLDFLRLPHNLRAFRMEAVRYQLAGATTLLSFWSIVGGLLLYSSASSFS